MATCFWQDLVLTYEDCVAGVLIPYAHIQSFVQSDSGSYSLDGAYAFSVAISGDTAVVGSTDATDTTSQEGLLFVYDYSGGSWATGQVLAASTPNSSSAFGEQVGMDGDYIVTTDSTDADAGAVAGAGYVFFRDAGTWAQQQKIVGSTTVAGDQIDRIDIAGDYIAMTSWSANHSTFSQPGEAFIFKRSGTTWTEEQRLQASDAASNDLFGTDVRMVSDTEVLISAPGKYLSGLFDAGAVYYFTRSGTTWTQQQRITTTPIVEDDRFGQNIEAKGDTAIITSAAGTYVFNKSGSTWTEVQFISGLYFTGLSDDELYMFGGDPSSAYFETVVYSRASVGDSFTADYSIPSDGSASFPLTESNGAYVAAESGGKMIMGVYSGGEGGRDDNSIHFYEEGLEP